MMSVNLKQGEMKNRRESIPEVPLRTNHYFIFVGTLKTSVEKNPAYRVVPAARLLCSID
jgi:hypothetical protein